MNETLYETGDVAICNACKENIVLASTGIWMHINSSPRHPAVPAQDWDDRYEEVDIEKLATLGLDLLLAFHKFGDLAVIVRPNSKSTTDDIQYLIDKYTNKGKLSHE